MLLLLSRMKNELAKSVNDFSFGMLFMSQVLYTIIMYLKGRKHRLQRMMFVFMAYLLSITAFEIVLFYLTPFERRALSTHITDIIEMTVVPWALLIIMRLTHPQKNLKPVAWLNACFYGAVLAAYVVTGIERIYESILIFTQIYSIAIIVYGFVAVRGYNKILADNFSDDKLALGWLKYIVYLYIGIIGVWSFATIMADDYSVALYNVSVIFAFGMFCYFVFKQEDMLEALEKSNAADEVVPAKALPQERLQGYHFAEHLEEVFRDKKIHLNPTLNINDLAQELGTNRTYVSNYLNQQLQTTFYEYVNRWRIEQTMELLETTDLSLDDIAQKSGFNSQSSFRRYFIAHVGMTPAAYRKRSN